MPGEHYVEAEEQAPEAPKEDRRKAPRFTLLIQTAKLIAHGGEFLCVVRDASQEGIRVRHFGYLPKERFFGFELANGEAFTVELVWQDEEFAGLKFQDEVNLERVVKLARNGLPKRQVRLETQLEGMVAFSDVKAPISIRNISQQGACIECAEHMAVGQLIKLETEDLEQTFARVRWRRETIYGLVFDKTISIERLATIVAMANSDEPSAEAAE
jgi:hypothetical protein